MRNNIGKNICPSGTVLIKIDPVSSNEWSSTVLPNGLTFSVKTNPTGQYITAWQSTIPIGLIIVKGGTNESLYWIWPQTTSMDGLGRSIHPPDVSGGIAQISHVSVCIIPQVVVKTQLKTIDDIATYQWNVVKDISPASVTISGSDGVSTAIQKITYWSTYQTQNLQVTGSISIDNPMANTYITSVMVTIHHPDLVHSQSNEIFVGQWLYTGHHLDVPFEIMAELIWPRTTTNMIDNLVVARVKTSNDDPMCLNTYDPCLGLAQVIPFYVMDPYVVEPQPNTLGACGNYDSTSVTDPVTINQINRPCVVVTDQQLDPLTKTPISEEVLINGDIVCPPISEPGTTLQTTITIDGTSIESYKLMDLVRLRQITTDFWSPSDPVMASDDAILDVVVAPSYIGCTYSMGYWKTHSGRRHPYDHVAELLINRVMVVGANTRHIRGLVPTDYFDCNLQCARGTDGKVHTLTGVNPDEIRALLSGNWAGYEECGSTKSKASMRIKLIQQLVAAELNLANLPRASVTVTMWNVIRDAHIAIATLGCEDWNNFATTVYPIWSDSTIRETIDYRIKYLHSKLDQWNNGQVPPQIHCSEYHEPICT
jgi:hypothetical protein